MSLWVVNTHEFIGNWNHPHFEANYTIWYHKRVHPNILNCTFFLLWGGGGVVSITNVDC